jgi:hypothetical protein
MADHLGEGFYEFWWESSMRVLVLEHDIAPSSVAQPAKGPT